MIWHDVATRCHHDVCLHVDKAYPHSISMPTVPTQSKENTWCVIFAAARNTQYLQLVLKVNVDIWKLKPNAPPNIFGMDRKHIQLQLDRYQISTIWCWDDPCLRKQESKQKIRDPTPIKNEQTIIWHHGTDPQAYHHQQKHSYDKNLESRNKMQSI